MALWTTHVTVTTIRKYKLTTIHTFTFRVRVSFFYPPAERRLLPSGGG